MKICIQSYVMLAAAFLISSNPAFAQRGLGHEEGIGRDNLQPEIVSVEGTLDHIKTGPCENTTGKAYIGTHLFLKSEEFDELVNVHLGAAFAVETFVNGLKIGENITAEVFQTDEMNPNQFIAKEITANGHTFILRDDNLRPFWAGGRNIRGRW